MGYDVFVSYSQAGDSLLSERVENGLARFAKPWWRRRALSVFRDRTSLTANPGLWSSIVEAIDASRFFVLLASPEAAASPWCAREVERWHARKGVEDLLILLTDGEIVWDNEANDFDWSATTALTPALTACYTEPPRYVDMRWARSEIQLDLTDGRFRDQIAELAAPVHGIEKDELAGSDVRQHRRTMRHAFSAGLALVLLTTVSIATTAALLITRGDLGTLNRKLATAQNSLDSVNGKLTTERGILKTIEGNTRRALSREVLAVGDSVMLTAELPLQVNIPGIFVDASATRRFRDATEVLRTYGDEGLLPQTVIVHVVSNGAFTASQFEEMMSVLGKERSVLFVNAREPRVFEPEINQTLAVGAKRHPNAYLVDWHGQVEGHSDWFLNDGMHLSGTGAKAYALFIGAQLKRLVSRQRDFVAGIESFLGQASSGRTAVTRIFNDLTSCQIEARDAANQMHDLVIDNRDGVLRQLNDTRVASPTAEANVLSLLQKAMESSLAVDTGYAKWIDGLNEHTADPSACPYGHPPKEILSADVRTSSLKSQFLTVFNPLASRFGMRNWQVSDF